MSIIVFKQVEAIWHSALHPDFAFFSLTSIYKRAFTISRRLLAFIAFCPLIALAETSGVTESDFLAEMPKVLTASRLAQPLSHAPAAVSVIDREMIEASGASNIAELLRLVPGFMVAERLGGQYTTGYKALGGEYSRYMQVLVDGVSIYQVYFGEVHWWTLPVPVEEVERIEVVRSPNAASFGSNAFQGVINIVTRDPATSKGGKVVLQGGTDGFYRGLARYSGGNELIDYRATIGVKRSTGFDNILDASRTPYVLLRGDLHLSPRDEVQLQFGQSETSNEAGFKDSQLNPPHSATVVDQFFQARWNHSLGSDEDISLQYARSRFRPRDEWTIMLDPLLYAYLGLPYAPYSPSLGYETGRDSFELTHRLRPSRTTQLAWGVETRRDFVDSMTWFYPDAYLRGDLTRLFANGEWDALPNLTLNAGAMLEKHYFSGSKLYPRLAANYELMPGHIVRASVSKGFRPPTFGEQKGNERFYLNSTLLLQRFAPNPNGLQPETVTSQEIGYLGEWRELGLSFDARISVDRYQDMIVTEQVSNPLALMDGDKVLMFKNGFDLDVTSSEFQARWRPNSDNLVVANFAHNSILSRDREAERSGPLNIGSLMVSHRFSPAWRVSATYYRYGAMDWLGGGSPISKYERLDMKLAWKLHPGHKDDELALVLKNALNRHNISFEEHNIESMGAFLALTLGF